MIISSCYGKSFADLDPRFHGNDWIVKSKEFVIPAQAGIQKKSFPQQTLISELNSDSSKVKVQGTAHPFVYPLTLCLAMLVLAAGVYAQTTPSPAPNPYAGQLIVPEYRKGRLLRSEFGDEEEMARAQLGITPSPAPHSVLAEFLNIPPGEEITPSPLPGSQIHLEGHIVAIDQLLKGLPPQAPNAWQEQGLLTANGHLWSFVPRGLGATLRGDPSLLGQYLQVEGIKIPQANHIEVHKVFAKSTPTPQPLGTVAHSEMFPNAAQIATLKAPSPTPTRRAELTPTPPNSGFSIEKALEPTNVKLTPVVGTNLEVNKNTNSGKQNPPPISPEATAGVIRTPTGEITLPAPSLPARVRPGATPLEGGISQTRPRYTRPGAISLPKE